MLGERARIHRFRCRLLGEGRGSAQPEHQHERYGELHVSSPVRSPFFLLAGADAISLRLARHVNAIWIVFVPAMAVVAVMRIGDAGSGAALRGAR
ncbi:MAG TPA: hypothetical protein VFI58_05515 [Xanthobacteraceae bacterium]|nr:hypothetical protein [Xanthobacteraceae bacterium]